MLKQRLILASGSPRRLDLLAQAGITPDRLLPMAPEFAELLQSVPVEERTGPVFKLVTRRGKRPTEWSVSKALSAIGEPHLRDQARYGCEGRG